MKFFYVINLIIVCLFTLPLAACEQPTANTSSRESSLSTIVSSHPRVLLTQERLELIVERMYGSKARAPYLGWFEQIRKAEDNGKPVDLVNLALLYKATSSQVYKEKFISRLSLKNGVPGLTELYAIDIMFNELNNTDKLKIMQRVAEAKHPWYHNSVAESQGRANAQWGYHRAHRVASAYAYSAIFANTDIENNKDPAKFPFDANNYISVVEQQLSEDGFFWQIENRIAGDEKFNKALPGDKGGMYDNIGYDSVEESYSIFLHMQYYNLTGKKRFLNAYHEKYRAHFYQHMSVPHTAKYFDKEQKCYNAGTKRYSLAQIWNTGSSVVYQPSLNTVAVTAFLFQDPKMQYYANNGKQRALCKSPYNGLFWELIYYDDTLNESSLFENETANYFNGPGIVTMRSDWNDDAAFGVFMAGESIGRRYEDANSFLISRKTEVMPHGGARVRFNDDNRKHFWYHIRSLAKNTLKIYDPNESYDIGTDGKKNELYSGPPLVDSDNFGGQLFEVPPSNKDLCFNTYRRCTNFDGRSGSSHPLGFYETANIIKYQHEPDLFTYSVGDASAAYSDKIDFFEREFFFLRPDVFVIFDRVQSKEPNFKKVWSVHTVDEPRIELLPSHSSMGFKQFQNAKSVTIKNDLNHTFLDILLPKENTAEVRGGDTVLIEEDTLSSVQEVELDIPRWLELFVTGSDVKGSLLITGETANKSNDSEEVVFDGRATMLYSSNHGEISNSVLYDKHANWNVNEWVNNIVTIKIDGEERTFKILANSKNTLDINLDTSGTYKYKIQQPIANSYKHWKKIKSISSKDMTIDHIKISVPHYFDATDIQGRLHSFAPHTDFKDDKYTKKTNLGQWTLNIESTKEQLLDNFLHVISLKDPGENAPKVQLVEAENSYGAIIEENLVIFAKDKGSLEQLTIDIPKGVTNIYFLNLLPNQIYQIESMKHHDGKTQVSLTAHAEHNALNQVESSNMGVAVVHSDILNSRIKVTIGNDAFELIK